MDDPLRYNDVRDAWNYYLQHDNNGRGVVLIGHSQGASILTQLIREQIEGSAVQSKLVSALLLGTNLPVPTGKDRGGLRMVPCAIVADRLASYAAAKAVVMPSVSQSPRLAPEQPHRELVRTRSPA